MDETTAELNELFAAPSQQLPPEVLGELQSILRLHSISPQELFYKWESYDMKMGGEVKLALQTARDFKRDLQDVLERETRGKVHAQSAHKRSAATPRAGAVNGGVYGLLDNLTPNTPRHGVVNGSAAKRKADFETPAAKASKSHVASSPGESKTSLVGQEINGISTATVSFEDRMNAGQIVETLNDHILVPEPPIAPPPEPRIKLKANVELAKFSYKPMAMKLSEASEILDDRIDEFLSLVQSHHDLPDSAFGNAASQSTSEIVAVGRIASDSSEGKLNAASLVLETSRRTGAGLRVPLHVDAIPSYDLFPGRVVALRGTNASGDYFAVNEILSLPLLPPAASTPADLDTHNARLRSAGDSADNETERESPLTPPLNIFVASGPYTPDTDLSFSALHALLAQALETSADALILTGPFLDTEHPLLASGDFDLPATSVIPPDRATLHDVFRALISAPINDLARQLPSITIIIVPSVRDAVARHVSWPQEKLNRRELDLPKQCAVVTNPVTLSVNELVVGISSQDVLAQMRQQECVAGAAKREGVLGRLAGLLVEQRHWFPLFPPAPREVLGKDEDGEERLGTGAMVDLSYSKLGEWLNVRPDVMVLPSTLSPFAKVIDSVLAINPGTLSKRRGPGTFARLTVQPLTLTQAERDAGAVVGHDVFERARVDVVRI
ncbi:hypothetical protein LTR04_006823 [Oleoguttula sp. CCFEE 6159]|nr:hypothetical protein LTR04_006823 [Oleoguttula sp. CCFEE 6159]